MYLKVMKPLIVIYDPSGSVTDATEFCGFDSIIVSQYQTIPVFPMTLVHVPYTFKPRSAFPSEVNHPYALIAIP